MEFNHPKGIYQQIADYVRGCVVAGEWLEGERIPSVREMAMNMGVNPNTVARSYQLLVDNMIVENRRGIGYFVMPTAKVRIRENMKSQFIGEELPQVFNTMKKLGISIPEFIQYYDKHKGG